VGIQVVDTEAVPVADTEHSRWVQAADILDWIDSQDLVAGRAVVARLGIGSYCENKPFFDQRRYSSAHLQYAHISINELINKN
jgi:hypothetical protein